MKISRNIVWNIAGATLPVAFGVFLMPAIVRRLGIPRFGLLSILWMLIGYFSIFDFGLSRTLTKMTADRYGSEREIEISSLVLTVFLIVVTSGCALSAVLSLSARWLVDSATSVPHQLHSEVVHSIYWLSVGLPFVMGGSVLFGALEGMHKFSITSVIRLFMGVMMFLVPYCISIFGPHLPLITAGLALVRIVTFLFLIFLIRRILPKLRGKPKFLPAGSIKPILVYGGWISVSNVIGPLLGCFDRFGILLILGSGSIAFYTVPYDTLSRILLVPNAMQSVLFAAFATLWVSSRSRVVEIFKKSSDKTILIMIPAVMGVTLIARPALMFWLGSEFANRSTEIANILIFGVLVNALARAPFALLQSCGFARSIATLQLVQLPLYGAFLWLVMRAYGLDGAAYVWAARTFIEAAALYTLASRVEPEIGRIAVRDAMRVGALVAGIAPLAALTGEITLKLSILTVTTAICLYLLLRDLKNVFSPRQLMANDR